MQLRAASASRRAMLAALTALVLAVRLLSPAGFMPSFASGGVTIVICPDAGVVPTSPAHHHDHGKSHQQPCAYAAAASAGALPMEASANLAAISSPPATPDAVLVSPVVDDRSSERPPSTGPPLLPA